MFNLFNVFWNGTGGNGAGGSSGVGGSGGTSGTDTGVSGDTGFGGQSATGFSVGFNAPTAAAVNAASKAANAFGGGLGGVGIGGTGQSPTGGFGGGQTAAVGGPTGGGGGTAAGGSASGPGGAGAGAPQGFAALTPDQRRQAIMNAISAPYGVLYQAGDVSVPPGLQDAMPTGPVTTSPLGPPSLNPNVIAQLNSQLSGLQSPTSTGTVTSALAPSFTGGLQSPTLAQLVAQLMGNTLGGLAPGGLTSIGQGTMGYPSVEGVSPGLTAMPGPSQTSPPTYATNSFQALNPSYYDTPSQLAYLAQQQANQQPTAPQAQDATAPVAPTQTVDQNALMAFLSMLLGNQSGLPAMAGRYVG